MAELNDRPFPPGDYPVVIVGTGPGGLQVSASLRRLGVHHALLSADDAPAGMFRRFPLFERLITWTKPYAPAERRSREYERYDWNSLLSEEPAHRGLVSDEMDGASYFPSRAEMERGIAAFTEVEGIVARYGCRWTGTARADDGRLVLATTDGEYRCSAAVFAVGMTEPWKPPLPGLEDVPHYVDVKPARTYADKRVFIIGKRNSGFELADALLPWARRIVLASPRPAKISVVTHSTASARARYLQPYEDHVLGGGHLVLDAAIERVERGPDGYRVTCAGTTREGKMTFEADEVIAATGFTTPLGDLPALGVATFYQGRLPSQTPFFESSTASGVYFAGSITQGAIGLKKYGNPSGSAAVHGFRYNARVLAEHIAATHLGLPRARRPVERRDVVGFLLQEATEGPELWHQQAYLARVVSFEGEVVDEGILPLEHFLDAGGPDAAAMTLETTADGEIRPAVYVRRAGDVQETGLPSETTLDFRTREHREVLARALGDLTG